MRWLWIALLVGACGSGSSTIDSSGGGDDDAPNIDATAAPTRLVAYIVGGADIAWYDVDKSTGALTAISSTPGWRTGANFLAFHGNYLYAVASGNRAGAYSIDPSTASLTFINDVA
ncbi:MAG TPA: hypothetical protein VFV99_24450, partial [Kofleriaceae bacterium]|nr:hypothetical protein [Kofleriaceae bacterium]